MHRRLLLAVSIAFVLVLMLAAFAVVYSRKLSRAQRQLPAIGEAYYPQWGNAGYDTQHIDLSLAVDVNKNVLSGTEVLQAKASDTLKTFNLDLRGLDVQSVTVNDKAATFTQQIGPLNMQNILEAFGWDIASLPQAKGIQSYAENFKALGCAVVAQADYNVRYFVQDIESLIFWLKAILHHTATGFPETFDLQKHWRVIDTLINHYQTPRGIQTNEHRQLLIVQAP